MALSRSASGPAGLSINTNSANSLFGSSTTTGGMFGNKPATGGLFGSTNTTSASGFGSAAAPSTGGLFGSTATTSQPQTGGLFGSTLPKPSGGLFGAAPASQPQQTGGLFGSNASTTQPAPSSLFGSTATTQPQTGGIFGAPKPAEQTTGGMFSGLGQQNQSSGGLFGAKPAQPAQAGGLFGSSTQSGGLFGGQNTQPASQPSSSLFGNLGSTQNQTSQPQQQSNAFGATQNQTGLFGNSLTGGLKLGQSNQQQQTVPGIRIDTQNIRGTSRYNDLHEELQNDILKLDKVIHDQMALKNQIDAMIPAHHSQLEQVPADVDFCNRKLLGAKAAADSDVQVIALARKQVEVDAENFRLSMKAIDNLRLPSQYHTTPGMWNQKYGSNDNRAQQAETEEIVGFFSKTGDELAGTLSTYQKTLTDIEQHLRGVEANSALQINALVAQRNGNTGGEENPFVILTGVLQDFEQSLLGVAGQVGAAREGVQRLQLGHFSSAPPKQKQGSRGGVY